ncbi:MAG: amidohydrolase family protein [archaeon]|nr:amidohydrolase family protein [archaeon]
MITIANGIILKGINLEPIRENILIDAGKIIEIAKDIKEGEIIDATGCVVCPSFVNAHTHIGDSIIKDEGYGLSIDEMVRPPNGIKHIALAEAEDDDIIEAMKESMWEMLNTGTSHFIDYREGGIEGIKLLKEANKDIPITTIILGRDDSFYGDNPDLSKVKIAIRKILKIADGIAPSGFGEITDEVAMLISSECAKQGKISSIHAAENAVAQTNSLNKFNKTEIQRAVDCNFNQVVHCTNPLNNDLNILSSVNPVVCPRANATLNVGIPPLEKMLNAGFSPLIGTDNLMLNSANMFSELEFTLKLMSVTSQKYLSPRDVLKLATTNVCSQEINKIIGKSSINCNNSAEFFIVRNISKNPYLNIINRSVTKSILYSSNIDNHIILH